MPVKQTPTVEATIWVARSVESTIKERNTDKVGVVEKMKNEGFSKSYKKSKFSKSGPHSKKAGGNDEATRCKSMHQIKYHDPNWYHFPDQISHDTELIIIV